MIGSYLNNELAVTYIPADYEQICQFKHVILWVDVLQTCADND